MTFPPDAVMCVLLSIHRGDPLEPIDGVLTVQIPLKVVTITIQNVDVELDELESREWIVIQDPRPTLTEKGLYALRRWLKTMVIVANGDRGGKSAKVCEKVAITRGEKAA